MIPRAFPGAKLRGVWPAIVVDNQDGPGNPGYRVRVKLPWLNDQEATHWARIALPMAGPERGTYVLPEIDDQVLVVFEHGDIARPIVVGALWSKQQEPVEVNESGSNNTKLIKSRSGHRIIFDDKDGAEKITIVDSTRKNKIVLDSANRLVRIESDGDIAAIAKANVILHANALKLGTSQQITGKGSSVLTHSARTFSVKAASSITIGGGNTIINTSNTAATSVSGSGAGELGAPGATAPNDQIAEIQSRGRDASGGHSSDDGIATTADVGSSQATAASTAVRQLRLTFVELELLDAHGRPAALTRYRVTGSDDATFSGTLDAKGYARIDGIPEGRCHVTFPDLHGDDWSVA